MLKKLSIVSIAGVFLLLVGLGVGMKLISEPQIFEKQASSPTGTAVFKLVPASSSVWLPSTQTIAGVLNTTVPIFIYQIIIDFTYTTANPPATLPATVTTSEPALSNCITNRVTLDTALKKYTMVVSCGTPVSSPPTSYTTNGTDKTLFTFNLQGALAGTLTYTFNTADSKVNSSVDGSDILAVPAGGSYTIQSDTAAPNAISNLTTSNPTLNSLKLNWSAPTDTGPTGKASSYDIRYSTSTITSANFASATAVVGAPTPGTAGAAETFTVTGLNTATTYFFAIKSTDSLGNISSPSNVATGGTLNQGSLIFNIKYQGVTSSIVGKTVNMTLEQAAVVKYTLSNMVLTASNGIYSATYPSIDAGTYDVFIKDLNHLRKKVASIVIASGTNTQNWPATPPTLLAGDINNDNKVDSTDYALLLNKFNPGATQTGLEDLNFDSRIDSSDYALLLLNFNPIGGGD